MMLKDEALAEKMKAFDDKRAGKKDSDSDDGSGSARR